MGTYICIPSLGFSGDFWLPWLVAIVRHTPLQGVYPLAQCVNGGIVLQWVIECGSITH